MNRRNFLTRLAALVPAGVLTQAAPIFAAAQNGAQCVRVTFDDQFKRNHQNLPQSIILPSDFCASAMWRAAFLGVVIERMEMIDIPTKAQETIAAEIEEALHAGSGAFSIDSRTDGTTSQGFTWKGRKLVANWGLNDDTVREMKHLA